MNNRKHLRLLCLVICIFLLIAHFNAITSYAAPLNKTDANKVIQAVSNTEQGNSGRFYSNLMNSSTVYIRSFSIRNLEAPVNGKLLDDTATVVADNGTSWDIPVIWVNKDGDIIHIAVEIDDIIRSYPIFVFYMPEKYSVLYGENASYNIEMPDFVVALMKQNGVTALSIPEADRTYISTFLPGADKLKINYTAPANEPHESGGNDQKIVTQGNGGNTPPVSPDSPISPASPNPSDPASPIPGSFLTPPTDNALTPPDPGLTYAEKVQVTNAHCDDNAISKLGVDKLAALVTWVKKTLEPEAANLLVSKFPAYKEAADNNELGKNIGLYIFYDEYDNGLGSTENCEDALAMVNGLSYRSGNYQYRVSVNASKFYNYNAATMDWEFDGTTNYSVLDNTLVHEMMHAYMDDYTRTGMTGFEESSSSPWYPYEKNTELRFPTWFVEGMASTVDNTFQYRYPSIHDSYGYDHYDYGYDSTNNRFDVDALKAAYATDPRIQIDGTFGEGSAYISSYLACIYLGYLAAKYDGRDDAISGDRIDSSAILHGENYILKKLHEGNSLSSIIAEISPQYNGKPMYDSTEAFQDNFIKNSDGSDGGASAEFCAKLLNYFQQNSTDTSYANGSILLDFADNNDAQLHLSLLDQPQTVYIPTDDKEYADSTVDTDIALSSGGTIDKSTNSGKLIVGSTATEELETNTISEEGHPGTDDNTDDGTIIYHTPDPSDGDAVYGSSDSSDDESTYATSESHDGKATYSITDILDKIISGDEPAKENTTQDNSTPEDITQEENVQANDTIIPPELTNTPDEQETESNSDADTEQYTSDDSGNDDVNSDDTNTQDTENVSSEVQTDIDQTDETAIDSESVPKKTVFDYEDQEELPDELNSDDEVIDVEVIREQVDESDEPIQNPLIISEPAPEKDDNNDDDTGSEQILDVIPEEHSDDESEATDAADPQTD